MAQTRRPEVVVITGASGGIGRATACEFARHGAHIGLIARGKAGLEGALRDVERLGGKGIIIPTDVSDPEAVEAAAATVEEQLGPIDIWVNVAFTSVFGDFMEITPDEYQRVTDVTYLGYVWGTRAALKRMLPRDRGTIVQVGSALAYRGIPLQTAYCGAKHAIQGFTEALRSELYHHHKSKVWVTMPQMPAVNTPQFSWVLNKMAHKAQPVPPIYQPEVAAQAVYWAAHHRKRQMFVGGSTAIVLTGNTFFPGLGDRYLGRTAYKSQQYDGAPDPNQPVNLWEPADANRDFGAHGAFDNRSINRSYELWISEHLRPLALAGMGLAAVAGIAALVARSQ
jgi:short-subunit dehydrogenase